MGRRVLKIRYSSFLFHFFGSEEKVSRVKGKLVSSCLSIPTSLSELQIPLAQNYPAGTSELIHLAPTGIYVEVVRNVDIVSLARNYPARTSELFPLGAKLVLRTNSTLRRNFSAGV